MMAKFLAVCTAAAVIVIGADVEPEGRKLGALSDYFVVCRREDPALSDCIRDSINGARPRLTKGIAALRVPPFDPLHIERLLMEESGAGLRMQFTLINATMGGFDAFNVTAATVEWGRPRLVLNVTLPMLRFAGGYDFRGRWLAFPVAGNGDFAMTVRGVTAGLIINLSEQDDHWHAERCFWDLEIEHAHSQFNNLFNGNEVLGKAMNELMNTYWREAFELYRGLAGEAFGLPFRDIANGVLQRFPLRSLFAQ